MTTPARTFDQVTAVLSDMDGTLYVSDQLIPGADRFVQQLRDRGTPLLFMTNNSSARAVKYRDRLRRLGIPAENEEILTSGAATAHHLRAVHRGWTRLSGRAGERLVWELGAAPGAGERYLTLGDDEVVRTG